MENAITLGEFIELFKYFLENNKRLVDRGLLPISYGICGSCGIGKTKSIESLAEELGMTLIVLNLSQLEEVGDLVGMPLKEFETTEGNWISADLINGCDFSNFTGKSRTSYAPPAWLPREFNPNGTILYLDDWNRGTSIFLQAVMQLIQDGKYISWSLPKYTTILLSSNPDSGEFNVSAEDPAQKSRYAGFLVKFSIDDWAGWAERREIDNRCINFALSYSSELFNSENHVINARSYTMFSDIISGIEDWSDPTNLAKILNIAKGCFDDPYNVIGNLFTTFIANKLDMLISPKDMLMMKWEEVSPKIESAVYDEKGKYRAAVASILHTRLLNYIDYYFSKPESNGSVVLDRLMDFIHSDKKLFDEDIIFNIIKHLTIKHPQKTSKMLYNPEIREKIL